MASGGEPSVISQTAIKDAMHAASRASETTMTQPAANSSRPDLDAFTTPPTSMPVSPMESAFPAALGDVSNEKTDISPVSADDVSVPATAMKTEKTVEKEELDTSAAPVAAVGGIASTDPTAEKQEGHAGTANASKLTRTETAQAIGPEFETDAAAHAAAQSPSVLALPITLLLTTGARHPFRLDAKYLAKRNVSALDDDPLNISVYTMKELIWRDWRDEWESRPASPTSIRLITFGRLLDDKITLRDCRLSPDQPNVVHMTVKPSDVDDEGVFSKAGRGSGEGVSAGCKCCIVM